MIEKAILNQMTKFQQSKQADKRKIKIEDQKDNGLIGLK